MKKLLKISTFALVMLLVVSFAGMAFATPSSEGSVTLTGASGNGKNFTAGDIVTDASPVELTPEDCAEEVSGSKASEFTVLWTKNVTVPSATADDYPLTISWSVEGVESNQTTYVYHYEAGDWKLVGQGGSAVSGTFSNLSPVGIAVRTVSGGGSPQTGENMLFVFAAGAAIIMGGVVACVSFKKKA